MNLKETMVVKRVVRLAVWLGEGWRGIQFVIAFAVGLAAFWLIDQMVWLIMPPSDVKWDIYWGIDPMATTTTRSELIRNLGLLMIGVIGLMFGMWRSYTAHQGDVPFDVEKTVAVAAD